jgi:hypothetical protein
MCKYNLGYYAPKLNFWVQNTARLRYKTVWSSPHTLGGPTLGPGPWDPGDHLILEVDKWYWTRLLSEFSSFPR